MRKEEGKENALPGREAEAEEYWFDGPTALGDVRITRTQAIKLAGLGGAGFLFTLLLPDTADARRRRRRRRRRAKLVSPVVVVPTPAGPTILNIKNPGDTDLTISEVQVLGSDGSFIRDALDAPVTIEPGDTVPVTITGPLVDGDKLRLIDAHDDPITVVDTKGHTLGDIPIKVLP